jgi:hypothetical protein
MIDLIIALSIFATLIGATTGITVNTLGEKETLVATLALTKKLSAIRTNQPTSVTIANGRLLNYSALPFNDCTLAFTANGTAAKARTCSGESEPLTLRPGEGGMGYPW